MRSCVRKTDARKLCSHRRIVLRHRRTAEIRQNGKPVTPGCDLFGFRVKLTERKLTCKVVAEPLERHSRSRRPEKQAVLSVRVQVARNYAVRSVRRDAVRDRAHGKRRTGHFTHSAGVGHADADRAGDLVERTAHNGYTVILSCLLRSAQHARELFFVDADKVKHFAPEAALSYIKINRGRLYRRLGDKFTGKPEEYKFFKKEYLFGFCPHIGAVMPEP